MDQETKDSESFTKIILAWTRYRTTNLLHTEANTETYLSKYVYTHKHTHTQI